MDRADQIDLARRLLAHAEARTTDSAPDVRRLPVSDYVDPELFHAEVEQLYKRRPTIVGLSAELPEVGSFLSITVVGVPIIVTRTSGGLKAFLNVCRHRGALVVPENCSGRRTRFTCPYHGWTYDNSGKLLAVAEAATFGPLDLASHGLTELAVAERCGFIAAILTPGLAFDMEEWMAGADRHMGLDPRLEGYTVVGVRTVQAANWKLVVEGHLEAYHFATLHANTVAGIMLSNCTAFDRFGPHTLITFAQKSLLGLRDVPEEQWQPIRDYNINPQYIMFPGSSVVPEENAILIQMVQPQGEPGKSISRLVYAVRSVDVDTPEKLAAKVAHLDYTAALVEDEDYLASHQIQRNLATGAQAEIVFGRNELGPQLFHDNLERELAVAAE